MLLGLTFEFAHELVKLIFFFLCLLTISSTQSIKEGLVVMMVLMLGGYLVGGLGHEALVGGDRVLVGGVEEGHLW